MPEFDDLIQLANATTPRIIKVIGVGGGGGNAVAQMYRDNIPEVRYVVINTDHKALEDNIVPDHLQLGSGLGAGGNPDRGRELAQDSIEKIDKVLDDETKMVFITAGMGGGTGTGASPIIAHQARSKGILTVGIVTIPFRFEREVRIDKALDGLECLSKEVDAMLVINNERLCEIYSDLNIINAFRHADETLSTAVRSITEIISMHGRINLDFRDVSTTLSNGGVAVMSSGYGEGEHRVTKAIESALNSPLLNNNDVYNAKHILLAITTDSSDNDNALTMGEMGEINEFMERFNADISTKWGLAFDPSLGSKIKITIIASGFKLFTRGKKRNAAVANSQADREQEVVAEETVEEKLMHDERRDDYYGGASKNARRNYPRRIHLFTDEDLRNEQLIYEVESVPTYRRSAEVMKRIMELSKTK